MLQVQLRVEGRTCLVVGGGTVGTRRARALLDAGADVVVVDPSPSSTLQDLASAGQVELKLRKFVQDDVDGEVASGGNRDGGAGTDRDRDGGAGPDGDRDHDPADRHTQSVMIALIVAATDDPAVNEMVGAAARRVGILINRADDAAAGDLAFPAVVRRGPIAIGVSTSTGTTDAVPALARWVAECLDEGVDQLLGLDETALTQFAALLTEVREQLRARVGQPPGPGSAQTAESAELSGRSTLDWHSAFDGSILDLVQAGRLVEAKERILACL
ncbi:MAG: bifunctional precorrin-2 dehydrogenase/sirohydrochlorin ferrochelatase [Microthrixaceae bacterium]